MDALVVFDSKFGNTRQVAQAIGDVLASTFSVQVIPVAEATPLPANLGLIAIGGPTQGHGASPAIKALLDGIGRGDLEGVPAAAFDTRFRLPRWLTGSAAGVIAERLKEAGGAMLAPPESFFVARASEGPLLPGELERARAWAGALLVTARAAQRQPVGG